MSGKARSQKIRLGIIGLGNMGNVHCRLVQKIPAFELAAVCDSEPDRLARIQRKYGVAAFDDVDVMLASRLCDAVLIATPHFSHTTIGVRALKLGYHVMVEKPISVHKADAEKLIRAHTDPEQVFAAMFNQRTNPAYARIRQMIGSGELGTLRRVQWTITDWFRSQAYYDSGGWRATWAGEGGGVLLNQCPHQLDLLQWMFGMPERVHAFCQVGKHHDIEVEDEVTAYLTYPGGATGVFTTTTGEAPGTNRLEVATDRGLLVYDTRHRYLELIRNEKTVTEAIAENRGFEKPDSTVEKIRIPGEGRQHAGVLENFARAIRGEAELIAPAREGIHSVELANAMLYSSWRGNAVELPISARGYAAQLKKRIATSRRKLDATDRIDDDMASSF
jgi:predicted dehydrogenase